MRVVWVGVFVAGLGAIACSSSSSGADSLDCAWLAGDNCWKTTATAVTSCLPSTTETGMLSADGRTCTYASGAVVTFATPIVFPLPDNPTWNFTIVSGGQDCVHYEDTNQSYTLVVGGQTVTESASGGLGISVGCPDGSHYANSNAIQLLSCDKDGGFPALPGNSWSSNGPNGVRFGLLGTSTTSSDELLLFDCAQ